MGIVLKKTFRFEAAHRLGKGYTGKCASIHGHSFNGVLHISCDELDEFGMGVDYGDIQVFLDQIESEFDHKLILDSGDRELIELCKKQSWELVVFENKNPTSEEIAAYIFEKATRYFQIHHPSVKVVSIRLAETCTAECEWTTES